MLQRESKTFRACGSSGWVSQSQFVARTELQAATRQSCLLWPTDWSMDMKVISETEEKKEEKKGELCFFDIVYQMWTV